MNIKSIKEKVRLVKLSHGGKSITEIFSDLNFVIAHLANDYKYINRTKGCNIKSNELRAVLINPNLSENELLEVLAHELGHVYLHPNDNTFEIGEVDTVWVKKIELEADTFASEFLLDDDIFKEYIDLNFEQLALKLGVSTKLVMLKFDNLSDDKKKEIEELYIDNYSVLYSI